MEDVPTCPDCKVTLKICGPETSDTTACLICPVCWYEEGGRLKTDDEQREWDKKEEAEDE